MAINNSIENFEMIVNDAFVQKAQSLRPTLNKSEVLPVSSVAIERKGDDWVAVKQADWSETKGIELAPPESVCIDFGDHCVGYVTLKFASAGSPPDAPAYIRLKFGELPCEIAEKSEDYHGSIGAGWIQEEFLHIDILPAEIRLPRRYAFRYLEVKVLASSPKYRLTVEDASCESVTSADWSKVEPLPESVPEHHRKMDAVSLKTMADCMQDVFEDGPKRDRRLWIGDLRLQALTNYVTFHNDDLVKRCLYLFGGLLQNERHVGACLFVEPKLQIDDTALFDYALFFISCLKDYYENTGDRQTLEDLWEVAYHQIELAKNRLDENYLVRDSDDWWCFLDWADGLNKQAGAQGVLIVTLKEALVLANEMKDGEKAEEIQKLLIKTINAASTYLWDEKKGFFRSGAQRQISWASQIWLILAGVLPAEKNRQILGRLEAKKGDKSIIGMVTPYMYHHYVEALFRCGLVDEAFKQMDDYWGQMIEDGADCFFELYDPDNRYVSPYGSRIINSYCHAWSCTPSYFIRKWYAEE
ncbi:MAG: sugar hydrolase [Clostridia bacterium]|nr:sugar hydrolase [Clostridia bacterium]